MHFCLYTFLSLCYASIKFLNICLIIASILDLMKCRNIGVCVCVFSLFPSVYAFLISQRHLSHLDKNQGGYSRKIITHLEGGYKIGF